jgi:hypothetical protein
VTTYDYEPGAGPVIPQCLWEGCDESDDLTVQEMAPGYTWSMICGRGHWIMFGKKMGGDDPA